MELKDGYKQTEVGLIPLNWEVASMRSLTTLMTNGFVGTAKSHYTESRDGVLYIQGYNVKENSFNFRGIKKVDSEFHKRNKKSDLKEGDLLTVQTGDVGLTTIVPKELEGSNCHALIISRFKKNKAYPWYYTQYFNSKQGRARLVELETGTTMKHINVGELQHWLVPLPPTLEEQKAIATALSDVDNLISNLDGLILKKKAIKQGAMQQLLTPDECWQTKTIKELATYRRGSFPQPYGLSKWYDDINGMPFVQVVDVDKNNKLKPETKQKISTEGAKKSVFVEKGTIILTLQGSIGRICITQYDAYVDRTLLIFESIGSDISKYFFMLSVWLKFQIEKENAPGGIIKTITKEALSKFEISYPDLDNQNRIAEILSDMDKEIEELSTKKEKYEHLKQGMMQELLTGKTRLI
jgi:type I restriction enzyme S subunit